MVARYYSSSLGRFLVVEPGDDSDNENPQSWNGYSYVRNNPLIAIDPDGEAVYFVNREFSLLAPSGEALPSSRLDSHTFALETDPLGNIVHTYSWNDGTDANDPTVVGKWHMDQPIDLNAARQALEQGLATWAGEDALNPYLEQAFARHYNDAGDRSNTRWTLRHQCKRFAGKLVREAKKLQRADKRQKAAQAAKEKKEAWKNGTGSIAGGTPNHSIIAGDRPRVLVDGVDTSY